MGPVLGVIPQVALRVHPGAPPEGSEPLPGRSQGQDPLRCGGGKFHGALGAPQGIPGVLRGILGPLPRHLPRAIPREGPDPRGKIPEDRPAVLSHRPDPGFRRRLAVDRCRWSLPATDRFVAGRPAAWHSTRAHRNGSMVPAPPTRMTETAVRGTRASRIDRIVVVRAIRGTAPIY